MKQSTKSKSTIIAAVQTLGRKSTQEQSKKGQVGERGYDQHEQLWSSVALGSTTNVHLEQ